jgi:hypothetical protein
MTEGKNDRTMVSAGLQQEIHGFVMEVNEPLAIDVEEPTPVNVATIRREYLPRALSCTEPIKEQVLRELRSAWRDNQDHGKVRHFGRAAINFAEYCVRPTAVGELSESEIGHAIDVIFRLRRWHHTGGSNIWRRFQPYASRVVNLVWGGLPRWQA